MDGGHPEWLPLDWKVCVRVRSSGKKDKYYVNSSNALKFNSKPEVLRYLQNAVKDPKGRKLNKVNMKKNVSERLPSKRTEATRITRKGGKTTRDPPSAGAEGQKLMDEEVNDTSSVNGSAGVENISSRKRDPPAENERQEKAAGRKKRKENSKWMNGLPRRSSKRLARVEADPPLEVKSSSRAARMPDEAEENSDDITQKSKPSGKTEVSTSEDVDKQKEATINSPDGNLSSAEEHDYASANLKQDEKTEKKLYSSLNDFFMDPCIEFAIKTLTGAIPLEEVGKIRNDPAASPSVLPFSDIWADPCFEFAVKTLTSEIPTGGDSHFKISFSSGGTGF